LGRALLLNASFEPLCVVAVRRAVVLVLKDKAVIVSRHRDEFRSERRSIPVPTVIRLVHYVRVPFRSRVPLSRRAVFARDGHRCQYCDRAAENIDHVVPRSRGGPHAWHNVVASCRSCNARKEDRFLADTELRLRCPPVAPHVHLWMVATAGSIHPSWQRWLGDGPIAQRAEGAEAVSA